MSDVQVKNVDDDGVVRKHITGTPDDEEPNFFLGEDDEIDEPRTETYRERQKLHLK